MAHATHGVMVQFQRLGRSVCPSVGHDQRFVDRLALVFVAGRFAADADPFLAGELPAGRPDFFAAGALFAAGLAGALAGLTLVGGALAAGVDATGVCVAAGRAGGRELEDVFNGGSGCLRGRPLFRAA
jgi:hypothetical protein